MYLVQWLLLCKGKGKGKTITIKKVRFAIIYTYGVMSYEGKYLWKHIKKACHLLRSSFLNKQQRIPWGTLSTHHKWQVETKNYSFHNESRKSRDTFDQLQNHKLEFLFIFIYLFIYWSHLPSPYPPKLNELILIF